MQLVYCDFMEYISTTIYIRAQLEIVRNFGLEVQVLLTWFVTSVKHPK